METLFEAMDIAEDKKIALQETFDKAVLKKTTEMLDEHVDTMVTEKVEIIEEEYKEKVSLLEDTLDGYLDTVVEEFIIENAPSYEAQIAEEKTKTLLETFDKMVTVLGVDMLQIQEAKEERLEEEFDASAENQVQVLETKLADMADKLVSSKREADEYLRLGVISETSEGLTILEKAKFEKLAEMVNFDRASSYLDKLETIKEQIVDSRSEDFVDDAASLPKVAFKAAKAVDVDAAMDFNKYV